MSIQGNIPSGFKLRYTLQGHTDLIHRLTWAPDGCTLASASRDKTIRLWNTETGEQIRELNDHTEGVNQVAWSPDGRIFASASHDGTIRLWDTQTGKPLQWNSLQHGMDIPSVSWSPDGHTLASGSIDRTIRLWNTQSWELQRTLEGHSDSVNYVAWSPDGAKLASGSKDTTIRIWDPASGELRQILRGHAGEITCVTWSPDGRTLASTSFDQTIHLWDMEQGRQTNILTGHTDTVRSVCFSSDATLLASNAKDGTVRLWRSKTGELIAVLNELSSSRWPPSIAFHPQKASILATLGNEDRDIHIWDLDINQLLGTSSLTGTVYYTNAKVVLVGDSGVGKSGLALVLTGQLYASTDSTHGRYVWNLDSHKQTLSERRTETRETMLWDLAGQPAYRLIHQLHLSEVAVALVVFDSHSSTDTFAGISHWVRALRMAQHIQGKTAFPVKKLLVAARIDRGTVKISRERIDAIVQKWGFDGYFETSALKGTNVSSLIAAIKRAIDWDHLPKVTSTDLFRHIKTFLAKRKEEGQILSTSDALYHEFLSSQNTAGEGEDLHAEFETCVKFLEAQGLIRRLTFGSLILLQPELLDS
jgi:small GTP-binding protein